MARATPSRRGSTSDARCKSNAVRIVELGLGDERHRQGALVAVDQRDRASQRRIQGRSERYAAAGVRTVVTNDRAHRRDAVVLSPRPHCALAHKCGLVAALVRRTIHVDQQQRVQRIATPPAHRLGSVRSRAARHQSSIAVTMTSAGSRPAWVTQLEMGVCHVRISSFGDVSCRLLRVVNGACDSRVLARISTSGHRGGM